MIPLPIRTVRLVLRDFRAGDFDAIHAYGGDPDVTRYTPWGPNSLDDTQGALDSALGAQAADPRLDYALAIELAGEVIGSVGLHLDRGPVGTAEVGYALRKDAWGRGIAAEAARALMDAGFASLGLHRIWATCDARNAGSFAVMEKLGMRREGLLIEDRRIKGEWRDTLVYAVLAREWANVR